MYLLDHEDWHYNMPCGMAPAWHFKLCTLFGLYTTLAIDGRSYCAVYKAKAVVQQGTHLVYAASICLCRHRAGYIAVPICNYSMENIDEIYHAACCCAQHWYWLPPKLHQPNSVTEWICQPLQCICI